jgi:hypothetical protein
MRTAVTFSVMGIDPTPWSVPTFGGAKLASGKTQRFSKRAKTNIETGYMIRSACLAAMAESGITEPIAGPVIVEYTFYTRFDGQAIQNGMIPFVGTFWLRFMTFNKKTEKWGKKQEPNGRIGPDLTNLVKAAEDALQGAIIHDDWCVIGYSVQGIHGFTPGVKITVTQPF